MDPFQIHELADRLEKAQRALLFAHAKAIDANNQPDLAMLGATYDLGARLGLYLTLLSTGKTRDQGPIRDVREFCELVEEMAAHG